MYPAQTHSTNFWGAYGAERFCYLGEPGLIGTGIYQRIAEHQQLKLRMPPSAGLIPDFEALRGPSFDPGAVDSRIRHFYEHAAEYRLEVWSEVYFVGVFSCGCWWSF